MNDDKQAELFRSFFTQAITLKELLDGMLELDLYMSLEEFAEQFDWHRQEFEE